MKCYDYAMKFIYNHPKTEQDLRIKLFQKWYSTEEVHNTMETLKQQKFIGDVMFAQMYINSEVIKKGKPLIVITKKLEMRWISKDILQKLIRENQGDMNEWIYAKIKKDIANYKKKWEEGFVIIQKLMRKGYKLDDIKTVINRK